MRDRKVSHCVAGAFGSALQFHWIQLLGWLVGVRQVSATVGELGVTGVAGIGVLALEMAGGATVSRVVICHWSFVLCHWSVVSGQW